MPYNHAMRHLDILLPFGLAPKELAKDLLAQLQAPSLAQLLGRASQTSAHRSDPYARSLPHERWLAKRYALPEAVDSSPPLATALMQSFGLPADAGTWFILQAAHLHIARDHLVLTDRRQLVLDDSESRILFDVAHPLFEESGFTLLYGDAHHWFVRADEWAALQTATPDAASGHNIDIWLPKGTQERAWRRLHNEVQMTWHTHELNMEREARRLNPVNALWLWGGATVTDHAATNRPASFSLPGAHHAFARAYQQTLEPGRLSSLLSSDLPAGLVILDQLLAPAMVEDWGDWLNRYRELEAQIFAPLLAALKAGTIGSLSLIITDGADLAEFAVSRNALRKFWMRPSLARLSR